MGRRRDARGRAGRQTAWLRATAAASSAALLGTLGLAGTSTAAAAAQTTARTTATAASAADGSCHLGNGVKHVVTLAWNNPPTDSLTTAVEEDIRKLRPYSR